MGGTPGGSLRGALRHPGFRQHLLAYAFGSAAVSTSAMVVSVVLYERSGSSGWAAAGAAARVVPFVLFSSVSGVLADRTDRRRLLTLCLAAEVVAGIGLALATGSPLLALAAMGFVAHVAWTPAYPVLASLVPLTVDSEDLAPANGLMSTVESVAWTVGPGLGGLLITAAGPSAAAASGAGLAALGVGAGALARRSTLRPVALAGASTTAHDSDGDEGLGGHEPFTTAWRRGLRTIAGSAAVALPLGLVLVSNLVYGATQVLLLLAATDLLGMSRGGFGALNAALGFGAFCALLVVNRAARAAQPRRVLGAAVLAAGLPLALLAVVEAAPVAVALLVVTGLGVVVTEVLACTALQRNVPADQLARVFGILDSLLVSAILLGTLGSPLVVQIVDVRGALVVVGAVIPLAAVLGLPRLARRPEPGAADLDALAPTVQVLAGLPVLRAASVTVIETLAAAAVAEPVAAGDIVIRQGDQPDDFFAVLGGQFEVSILPDGGSRQVIATLGPGTGFGEIGLLHGVPRTASVTAVSDGEVLRVPGTAFLNAVGTGVVTGGMGITAGPLDYVVAR
jgi:predicted MFS family arabinose efflux permease